MAISSPIKPSTFIVPSRLKELKAINVLSKKLYEEKKTRYKLEKRLYALEKRSAEKSQFAEKESGQESSKVSAKKSAGKFLYKQGVGLGSALFGFLQFFITYKAVEWISKPENSKKVLSIVKALKGIFDFVSWFVTGTIDNTFSGLHSVIFGENLLERFLGFFRLLVGLLGFRYLLNPGKIFKDLSFVIKNGGKILEVFNTFRKAGLKEGSEALLQTLPKTAQIFKHGLARGLGRGLLKVFGKGGVRILSKLLGPAFKAVRNIVLGPIKAVAKTTVKGIPIVGPLLDLGINLILGDPIDKAIVKAAGSALGMGLGGLVGSAFPGPGTIVGGALGGLLGDWAADKLYGWVKGLFSKKSDDVPQLAVGGIVTQPTKAIIGEAGPEAVIPLGQLYSGAILSGPLGMLGSSIIGGVNAVLFSMGTIGNIIRPFAQQLFAPFTKEFGVSRFTFASNLGNTSIDSSSIDKKTKQPSDKQLEKIVGSNKPLTLISSKSSTKKTRYNTGNSVRELLADIFNNILNLDTSTPGGGGGGSGGPGGSNEALTAAELDAIKASSADKRAAAHLATLEASAPQHVADVYQVILNRAAGQSGGIPAVITAKEQFSPYSAAIYGGSADGAAAKKYGGLGLTKKELFDLAGKSDGIQQLTNRFQAGNPKVAAQVLADFDKNGPLSQSAKKFVGGSQYFMGYRVTRNDRRRPDGGNFFRDRYQVGGAVSRGDITSHFANKESFRKHKHEGIDIGFPVGTPLSFASKGEFTKVSKTSSTEREANGGYGSYIDIKLVDRKIARLAHLSSIPSWVKPGGKFNENTVIAMSGGAKGAPGSGRSGGPHLHLEQHTAVKGLEETLNGKVDPLQNGLFSLLRKGGITSTGTQPPTPGQQPSVTGGDVPSTTPEEETPPEVSFSQIAKDLNKLYRGLTGKPKLNGTQLERSSMDMIQAQNITSTAFMSDTYIIAPPNTVANSVNLLSPLPAVDYTMYTSYANLDSSTSYLQRRL